MLLWYDIFLTIVCNWYLVVFEDLLFLIPFPFLKSINIVLRSVSNRIGPFCTILLILSVHATYNLRNGVTAVIYTLLTIHIWNTLHFVPTHRKFTIYIIYLHKNRRLLKLPSYSICQKYSYFPYIIIIISHWLEVITRNHSLLFEVRITLKCFFSLLMNRFV